jgi:hypothetical protein
MADRLLDHIADPMASLTAGSAYNRNQVSQTVAKRIRTLPSVRLGLTLHSWRLTFSLSERDHTADRRYACSQQSTGLRVGWVRN